MIGESIERIKKAEENAKNQVEETQAESERTLRDAREKAEEIAEEAKKKAAAETKLIIGQAEEEAAREVVSFREQNETDKAEIRKTAQSNRAEAASFIIGRVIG